MRKWLLILSCLWFAGCATTQPPNGLLGAYRLDDGRAVSIRRSVDGTLRYRLFDDGTSGRLYRESGDTYVSGAGFAEREPIEHRLRFVLDQDGIARQLTWSGPGVDGSVSARRIGAEREVTFVSHDARLSGRLHLPAGPPPYPVVVLVHGSGDSIATEWLYNGDFYVANGIAALTYDKRGTGQSAGSFTFDFDLLADDVVAAVDHLASLKEIDRSNIGLAGYSQGGWVAPLAASKDGRIGFVVVNYGIIESPAEEARLEMRQILLDGGVSGSELESADELIRASIDVVAGEFRSGWDRFEELKRANRGAAWLWRLDGTPVGQLIAWPKFAVRLIGPRRLPPGLPWRYDSYELLQKADVPMVWLLGGQDRSAPNAQTISRLRSLIEAGKPFELVLFPNADHGMLVFDKQDGQRAYTGYAPGYFRAEIDAAKRMMRRE